MPLNRARMRMYAEARRQHNYVEVGTRRAERDTQARLAEDVERTNRLLGITRADVAELLDEPLLEVDEP